jgi:flagellar biosynthetic protein FliR
MVSFTDAYLQSQLALFLWPLARILGLIMSMPFLSDTGVPTPVKILLGVLLTLTISTTLGPLPEESVGSWAGLVILLRELIIGSVLGLTLQCLFAAVSLGGEMVGTQMGLGFSTLYDPGSESTTTTLSSLWVALACLTFFAMDGHLMVIASLIKSFEWLPIRAVALSQTGFESLFAFGGLIFLYGVALSLPVTLTMILINLALGILARAAPQLNLFSIGFPLTLMAGLAAVTVTVPDTLRGMSQLWLTAIDGLERLSRALVTAY